MEKVTLWYCAPRSPALWRVKWFFSRAPFCLLWKNQHHAVSASASNMLNSIFGLFSLPTYTDLVTATHFSAAPTTASIYDYLKPCLTFWANLHHFHAEATFLHIDTEQTVLLPLLILSKSLQTVYLWSSRTLQQALSCLLKDFLHNRCANFLPFSSFPASPFFIPFASA